MDSGSVIRDRGSVKFSKSEFKLLANSTESWDEANICVSSAYRHGVADFKQLRTI